MAAAGPVMLPQQSAQVPLSTQASSKRGTLTASATRTGRGGGGLQDISQAYTVNSLNGTMSLQLPIPISASRSSCQPDVVLGYDSGQGNGPLGIGWNIPVLEISRKTSNAIPQYTDADVIVLSGGDDLVPVHSERATDTDWLIQRYRPRNDSNHLRIQKWTHRQDSKKTHWRTISSDNFTTIFGDSDSSRIADTLKISEAGQPRVFSWLCSKAYDSLGNVMEYIYKADALSTQKYLKRIRYGNRVPNRDLNTWQPTTELADYLFEVVFDYGEHDVRRPTPTEANPWNMRKDPFSRHNSGFEIRTCRLCTRVMVFHHMSDKLVRPENLVSSVVLGYEHLDHASKLVSVTIQGHTATGETDYTTLAMPTSTFQYQKPTRVEDLKVITTDMTNINQLPNEDLSNESIWIDFNGEGMPGLLSCPKTGEWSYQRNENALNPLSNGSQFSVSSPITCKPSFANGEGWILQDVNQDGKPDLCCVQVPGFFERITDDVWQHFQEFPTWPSQSGLEQTMIKIDVTGNGLMDLLWIEPQSNEITWYPSLGKDGFGPLRRVKRSSSGPIPPSGNSRYDILTADMSGDGLADLVFVSKEKISYWPNQGYGHFGDEVIMRNGPILDKDDMFTSERIRFADIDGSGTSDIIYFPSSGSANIYYNLSGSAWSDAQVIASFPRMSSLRTVSIFDLLGKGTPCLCWSDNSQIAGKCPLRYIDLMAGGKPHIMSGYSNGIGMQVDVKYRPSTWYYLNDDRQGKRWQSALPFPVHCVDTLTVKDDVTTTESSTTYAYHEGYYDVIESEFRGFGMVEAWTKETFLNGSVEKFTTVPVYTKTWYHTGAKPMLAQQSSKIKGLNRITCQIPTIEDQNGIYEAYRALKGCQLREEVYGQGLTAKENILYTVNEHAYDVRILQPSTGGSATVLATNLCETLSFTHDGRPLDPHVSHLMVVERDDFGNPLKQVSISYGRTKLDTSLPPRIQAAQQANHIGYEEFDYTNSVVDVEIFRGPAPCGARVFKLSKVPQIDIASAHKVLEDLGLSQSRDSTNSSTSNRQPQKSPDLVLISESRTFYNSSDFKSILFKGKLEAFSTIESTYDVVYDDKILGQIVPNDDTEVLGSLKKSIMTEAGYVDLDTDGRWWRGSGRQRYSSLGRADVELMTARKSFYHPLVLYDVLNNKSTLELDSYKLFQIAQTDPAGNSSSITFDYQRLLPVQQVDINGNREQTEYDTLGAALRVARMGKDGELLGDSLDGSVETDAISLLKILKTRDLDATALKILGNAGHVTVHCRNRQEQPSPGKRVPAFTIGLSRDKHFRDGESKVSVQVTYQDGHGGPFEQFSLVSDPGAELQWLCNGLNIHANAGQAILQHRPFYCNSCDFIEPSNFTSPRTYSIADACGRPIGELYPDHSWTKMVYSPWETQTYSTGDTVLTEKLADDPNVGRHFSRLPTKYLSAWYANATQQDPSSQAAQKSRVYHNTPTTQCIDALGRTIAHITSSSEKKFCETQTYDLAGNLHFQHDARGRLAEIRECDLLGRCFSIRSMDGGDENSLLDAMGNLVYSWKSRVIWFKFAYDALGRQTEEWKRLPGNQKILLAKKTYGEAESDGKAKNLRGQLIAVFDQAGVHRSLDFDFKGNCIRSSLQCTSDFKSVIDWSKEVGLLPRVYENQSRYDAFDRAFSATDPLGNITSKMFNRAGRLISVFSQPRSSTPPTCYVSDTRYSAEGEHLLIKYGNGNVASWVHDDISGRLLRSKLINAQGGVLQDLNFVYDVEGRMIRKTDKAQQTVYFSNNVVEPSSDYTYDAIGQLVRATGRESVDATSGTTLSGKSQIQAGGSKTQKSLSSDGKAMFAYTEEYEYDDAGVMTSMKHDIGGDGRIKGWTRTFFYEEKNRLQGAIPSNRLSRSVINGKQEEYVYDGDGVERGCMTKMPTYSSLTWDFNNLMKSTSRQKMSSGTPETTWYVYDHSGRRVRKVSERAATGDTTPRVHKDTLYLGDVEIQRKYSGNGNTVEYEKHIATVAGASAVALVERDVSKDQSTPLIRYQFENSIETDDKGQLVSYEEYSPFGMSTYTACRSDIAAPRAYRFAAYERDKETGLFYCGLRYYAPWLGKWLSADPGGSVDGLNLFRYCRNDPVNLEDSGGMAPEARRKSVIIPGTAEHSAQIAHRWTRYRQKRWAKEETYQMEAAGKQLGRSNYVYSEGQAFDAEVKWMFTRLGLQITKWNIKLEERKFEKAKDKLEPGRVEARKAKKKADKEAAIAAAGKPKGFFGKIKRFFVTPKLPQPEPVLIFQHKRKPREDLPPGSGVRTNEYGTVIPQEIGPIRRHELLAAHWEHNPIPRKYKEYVHVPSTGPLRDPVPPPMAPWIEDYSTGSEGKAQDTKNVEAFGGKPEFENWMPRRRSAPNIDFSSPSIASTWWGTPILPKHL